MGQVKSWSLHKTLIFLFFFFLFFSNLVMVKCHLNSYRSTFNEVPTVKYYMLYMINPTSTCDFCENQIQIHITI